jgi:hypothetical protein
MEELIGKQIRVGESFNPATNKTLPATYGEIIEVDDTGTMVKIERAKGGESWHDSRTIEFGTPLTEEYMLKGENEILMQQRDKALNCIADLESKLEKAEQTKPYLQVRATVLFSDNTWQYYHVLLIEVYPTMEFTDKLLRGYVQSKWADVSSKKQAVNVIIDDRPRLRYMSEDEAKSYDSTL